MLWGFHANGRQVAFIAGDGDAILRTTNGGQTWQRLGSGYNNNPQPPIPDWKGLHFLNDQLGYVVGSKGLLLRTSNRGTTWEFQFPRVPPNNSPILTSDDVIWDVQVRSYCLQVGRTDSHGNS